jgi:hypothetical protein
VPAGKAGSGCRKTAHGLRSASSAKRRRSSKFGAQDSLQSSDLRRGGGYPGVSVLSRASTRLSTSGFHREIQSTQPTLRRGPNSIGLGNSICRSGKHAGLPRTPLWYFLPTLCIRASKSIENVTSQITWSVWAIWGRYYSGSVDNGHEHNYFEACSRIQVIANKLKLEINGL